MRRALRAPLVALAAALFAFGWVFGVAWFALTWCGAAVRVGWREGRR